MGLEKLDTTICGISKNVVAIFAEEDAPKIDVVCGSIKYIIPTKNPNLSILDDRTLIASLAVLSDCPKNMRELSDQIIKELSERKKQKKSSL